MSQLLWRIEGVEQPGDPDALAAGLQLHLVHTSLRCVAMQIGAEQHSYLRTEGCEGCRRGRHRAGCRVELIRRVLMATCGPTATLVPVPAGLAPRQYTAVVVALPTAQASELGTSWAWEEARLVMDWRGNGVAALLATGAGPDPMGWFAEQHWSARRLPLAMGLPLANAANPASLRLYRSYQHPPFLLFPQQQPV